VNYVIGEVRGGIHLLLNEMNDNNNLNRVLSKFSWSGPGKGAIKNSKSTSGNGKHLNGVEIPSVRNNEFNKWFDNLSLNEFEEMWNNTLLRIKIEDRLRRPGGYRRKISLISDVISFSA
jgi:hypothetical protein